MQPLLKSMPKKKIKHSTNVGKTLHKSNVGKIGIYAGLLHDYLERGGSIETLTNHINDLGLPESIINIVQSLSSDEKNITNDNSQQNEPLNHLKSVISNIADQDIINIIVLVKLSDRIDNLTKRKSEGKIGNNYLRKSIELYNYLKSVYSGENKPFKKLSNKFAAILK